MTDAPVDDRAALAARWRALGNVESAALAPQVSATARALWEAADMLDQMAAKLVRLAELETMMSGVRHDIRGMLSPMMLVSDRLAMNADPKVVKCAETLIKSIKRIDERLVATRMPDQSQGTGRVG